ncbi:MAG: homoserine dehydrogenase [Candidatus Adiutrix sp.]|jgi:homoserine dehydrogenase|nr:homoserine dehydrogenase [Candidatus Adiutrix sp.]
MQTTVGLLGCGNVGSGVARMLVEDGDFISRKLGWPLRLAKIGIGDFSDPRPWEPPSGLLTTNAGEIIGNPDIRVVVEVMGGLEPARTFILKALNSGQHVVTANKALLARHGREIFEAAAANKVEVLFEAAVAGGIPIIRTMKEGLSANRIRHLLGILNGTTNYILTRMSREALGFQEALAEAQKAGYAEADPTFDIEGYDAAHKLILLTALAYGSLPALEDIHVEGISRLTPEDISFAAELGYVIKLLALASRDEQDRLEVRLHPAMLPRDNLLSNINGALNAVLVSGHAVGDILQTGAGAGMMPTASSVLADIIELARADHSGVSQRVPPLGWPSLSAEKPKPMAEVRTAYYLRLTVADRPGVLAAIAGIFAGHSISLAQVIQKQAAQSGAESAATPLVILTHTALERDMTQALAEIGQLDSVLAPTRVIRVEDKL